MKHTNSGALPQPRWKRVLRPALVLAALLVVFAWLLPQFIDYEQVWEALTELDGRGDPRNLLLGANPLAA